MKSTGRQIFIRSVLTAALPLILIYAFFEGLWRGLRSAFWHAWLEVRANFAIYRDLMRREEL